MSRSLAGAAILILLSLTNTALAASEINKSFFGDVAIEGYDPVAYFQQDKPVKGKKEFEHEWKGANWRFSSAENRKLFADNPEQYAPQYGGYCAYAVAENSTAGIDPYQFTIVDNKLYLNYNKKIQSRWLRDRDAYIKKADENWPEVIQ